MSGTYFLSIVILSCFFRNSCAAPIQDCGLGKGDFIGHVAGGKTTKHGDWPWLVALIYRKFDRFFCGGSLISAQHVLSAAHCFQYKRSSEVLSTHHVKAFLGKFNLSDENEDESRSHLVRAIVIHPEWKYNQESYDADIAILVLAEAATFDIFARPVCLPVASNNSVTGTGIVAGWGKSENSGNHYESTPSVLEVPAIDDGICYTTVYKLGRYSSPRMFCGGFVNQSKATCTGDSGGGFYTIDKRSIWTIRGIVSGGLITAFGGCDVNAFSLYTNVAKLRDWITGVMARTKYWSKVKFDCYVYGHTYCHYKSDEPITSNSKFSAKQVLKYQPSILRTVSLVIDFLPSDSVLVGIGEGFPKLNELIISGESVKFVERRDFVNMSQLKELLLRDMSINFLPDDLLSDLPDLEIIGWTKCKIDQIPERMFVKQRELKKLYLFGNKLTVLKKNLFKFNLKLELVTLNGNNIKEIFVDFTKLTAIRRGSINLRNNDCISRISGQSVLLIERFQHAVRSCCTATERHSNKSNCLCFPDEESCKPTVP